ncbi:MAG: VOC family protein [Usitatibacter sp.]
MTATIQPYLDFNGRAEEAIEFYKQKLGAKVEMIMRNKEAPEQPPPGTLPPNSGDKVMHSSLHIGDSVVMITDGYAKGKTQFAGFSLTLNAANEADAKRLFNALAEGGEVKMALGKTFFSKAFGMLNDKFGLGWIVIVPQPMP